MAGAEAGPSQLFGNISLGTRGGANQGSLKVTATGLAWKRSGGGKSVEVAADDIAGLEWSRVSRGYMLSVRRVDGGPSLQFLGFRDPKDLGSLRAALGEGAGEVREAAVGVSGHNWGRVRVEGSSLVFEVGGRPSFRVPLPDVAQVQQGREEVMLEFPIDDTLAGDRADTLMEMAFHVPRDNRDVSLEGGADGEEAGAGAAPEPDAPAARMLFDAISRHTEAGAATGDAVVTFDQVGVLVPRGRFDVEMYMAAVKLVGQAQDYRIQYSSIVRIFLLPKTNVPQTLVAIALDPPIRKGQTFYTTILAQFPTDEDMTAELDISDDALAAKNDKCGGKLARTISGPAYEVFARVLRGLSGAKLTKPGAFRDAEGTGYAVKCSYKADDGYLYPLERAFFYVQKPPTLLVYDDVDSVEFMRQSAGVSAAKTFDLAVRMRAGQDYLFRGIPRGEWSNLFEFIQAKQLRIENFKEAQRGPGAAAMTSAYADAAELDAALGGGGGGESDADDEDFAASESESSGSEGDDADSSGAEMVSEDDLKPKAKKSKAERPSPAPAAADGGEGGGSGKKEKKKRAKKDKNAPKRALSAYMYYSNAMRNTVREENPGIAFAEVAKVLGQRWKELSAANRAPYEEQAVVDKERYEAAMREYKASSGAAAAAAAAE